MPNTMTDTEMNARDDEALPSVASDGYADIVRELGQLYDRMKAMIDQANAAGDMDDKAKEELKGLRSKYDRLVELRDANHAIAKLASESRQRSYAAERAERAAHGKPTDQRLAVMARTEYRNAFADYLRNGHKIGYETRALSEGTDADGGFLPSQDFYNQLAKVLEQEVVLRKIATILPLGTFKTNIAVESAIVSAGWGTEAASVSVDSTQAFAQRQLTPKRLAVIVQASMELIEDAPSRGPGFSVESIVADQMARAFAITEENGFVDGTGSSGQPKGLFRYTGASEISTGKTTAANNAITANEIIDLVYSLPRQYRTAPGVAIVAHDSTLAAIRKLTSPGTSPLSYLWEPSFKLGEPDRLMGIPVYASQYAPEIGSAKYPIVIGDFSRFVIGVRSGLSVRVLRELYAGNGQIGFQGVSRVDCAPLVFNAFRYLKMAT
jgi:HK97 family phage major capsid protein